MSEATFTFPPGFLWGTATSAHQVEGNNTNNDWYRWEQEGHILDGSASRAACDWWSGRWQEDFDRAADGGQNTHRLSVEWSRVQPTPNRFDESEIEFYRELVRGLRQRGLRPMVTLHHFTNPIWLQEMQGWESDFVVDYFQDFVYRMVSALGEYVDLWCTINEPNVYAFSSYFLGVFPPGKKSLRSIHKVLKNLVKAHAAAYQEIHSIQREAMVGVAHQYRGFSPAKTWSPPDCWAANLLARSFNLAFPEALQCGQLTFLGSRTAIPQARNTQDFFGLNYYTREYVAFSPFAIKDGLVKRSLDSAAGLSPTGFIANEPATFFQAIKWAQGFGLPIYITENGVEDEKDDLRPQYLLEHIHQVWRGVNFNWWIRGYFYWTLVDNFEWERGWTQRFGLWSLDPDTQVRTRRRSAALYEAICRENALTSAQVSQYVPELKQKMFPG